MHAGPALPPRELTAAVCRAQIKAEIKSNELGVRGLYATEDVKKGRKILVVPGSCSLPLGLYEHAGVHVSRSLRRRQ